MPRPDPAPPPVPDPLRRRGRRGGVHGARDVQLPSVHRLHRNVHRELRRLVRRFLDFLGWRLGRRLLHGHGELVRTLGLELLGRLLRFVASAAPAAPRPLHVEPDELIGIERTLWRCDDRRCRQSGQDEEDDQEENVGADRCGQGAAEAALAVAEGRRILIRVEQMQRRVARRENVRRYGRRHERTIFQSRASSPSILDEAQQRFNCKTGTPPARVGNTTVW